MTDVAIRAEHLSKQYRLGERQARYRTLRSSLTEGVASRFGRGRGRRRRAATSDRTMWALQDVSFEITRGEVVGIIGRNGAGKSTLLKVLSRITEPTTGAAEIHGRVGSLLEVGTGFHNELTGRENIFLNGAILGMRAAEIRRRFDEIVAFAEVQRFVDTPVKHYSTGMYLRLAFAVAAHLEPDVLLVDEVLAVGDVAFQTKCLGKMNDVARQGRTVLLVSHNMGAIRSLCRSGIVLNEGHVVATGAVAASIEAYYRLVGALQTTAASGAPQASGFGPVIVNDGLSPINHSEGFTVTTTFRAPEDVAGYAIYATLTDMHGRRVFALVEGHGPVPEGRYRVRFECPALWLATGLYSLHFKILFWGSYGSSRYVSDHIPIDFVGGDTTSDGCLVPAARWAVDPEN